MGVSFLGHSKGRQARHTRPEQNGHRGREISAAEQRSERHVVTWTRMWMSTSPSTTSKALSATSCAHGSMLLESILVFPREMNIQTSSWFPSEGPESGLHADCAQVDSRTPEMLPDFLLISPFQATTNPLTRCPSVAMQLAFFEPVSEPWISISNT